MENTSFKVVQGLTVLSVALFVLFFALKLSGVIAWSWLWVFAPILIPICITILALILLFALLNYLAVQQSKEVQK